VVDDGSVAVEKLVDERAGFDLAFFDINMPIMVGWCSVNSVANVEVLQY